jgi:MFS family permease
VLSLISELDPNQKKSFFAAWAGWGMDGMDGFIYALVLVPALQELLPRSGIEATQGNVGGYGALLFALFMVGWGLALLWGPVADRFGRVRTLTLTILMFSFFTFAAGLSTGVWSLAIFRLLAGIGIGGEWSIGASLVNEAWPEKHRTLGGGIMHTGYYFGFLVAALLNYMITPLSFSIAGYDVQGWRLMFFAGGVPALLVAWMRRHVHEPEVWHKKVQEQLGQKWSLHQAFFSAFTPEYRGRTILNSIYMLASITGLWAGSIYVPTAVRYFATGRPQGEIETLVTLSGVILAVGTILGALLSPFLGDWIGRRGALGFFYGVMLLFIPLGFGHIYYMGPSGLWWFMLCSFFLGIGGASFAVYSFWLPEQYRTEFRVSAFAFSTNIGRFVGAGITYALFYGIRSYGSLGVPVAWTAIAFALALVLLPFGVETKGKGLPT